MKYLLFFIILFLFPIASTFAYLDPGTGSMIVSAIIGFLATILYIFRGFFYKVIGIFRKKGRADTKESGDTEA